MQVHRHSEGDAEGAFRNLLTFFDINVIGVLKTVYGFLPLVKKGNMKKFIAISTGMGNIGAPYRSAIL